MPKEIFYLAYGSNMSGARLAERVGQIASRGIATLAGHILKFHKLSRDGTGKCDACETGNADDKVIGVVFTLSRYQKPVLDRFEGLGFGYKEKQVSVTVGGDEIEAMTYVADESAIRAELRPTRIYRQHVLDGAAEHGISQDYIAAFISSVPTID